MIEAAAALLALAAVVFVVGVRLGIILGARLDRLVASPTSDDGGAPSDRGAGSSPAGREGVTQGGEDEGSVR